MAIKRRSIDWKKTGEKLKDIRLTNDALKSFVCHAHNKNTPQCDDDCFNCCFGMCYFISRRELGEAFGVSDSVVLNWEHGRSAMFYEDLELYARIIGFSIEALLCYKDD